jgi:hypothetical protein
MNELIIGDDPFLPAETFSGSRGLVYRDMDHFPVGSFAPPTDIQRIPRNEWSARIREMERTKSRLSDLRMIGNRGQMIPSLDQGSWGYCWAHGPVAAMLILRAKMGLPYVPLSAFGTAYTLKNGRNEGAWAAMAVDFLETRGCPKASDWPRDDRRMRPVNDPIWNTAKNYRITDGWMELEAAVYDRDMTFDQVMTCLLNRIPVCCDFYWWGHSVVALDPVEVAPNRFGIRIWNSWSDSWGDKGMSVLTDSKCIPDNAVAPSLVTA